MKSLIHLAEALLTDVGRICSVETARDRDTLRQRAQHEGSSFLTITLPDFATDFERCLELGKVDSTLFAGWRKRGCLPAFLRGFTSLVFGTDGRVLNEPEKEAVYCIRQFCRFFKKVKLQCSSRRTEAALKKFRQVEADLCEDVPDDDRLKHFLSCGDLIWGNVLQFGDEFFAELVPRHGPGATAEGAKANAKYSHRNWYERLDRWFPVADYLMCNYNQIDHPTDGLGKVVMVGPEEELPVKVTPVPKTLKTPRIIAIEPVCMQYAQQALLRWLVPVLQGSDLLSGAIRFTDQTVNQRMALAASLDGSHSTIDLSDASDRVPLSMVRQMLRTVPDFLGMVEACRSRKAKLPDGEVLTLRKFASMGSALCFPIESMYFYTIIVHSILWKQRKYPCLRDIRSVSKRIHIFGDDIIVPTDETDTVIEGLAHFKCKVNTSKSFWNGKFRESCGVDGFMGQDVTPVYLRELRPSHRRAASSIVSWVATSNLLFKAGCWQTADVMKNGVESLLGKLPVLGDDSPGLGWSSFQTPPVKTMCIHTQVPIVRTYSVRMVRQDDRLDGYPALLKYFLRSHGKELQGPTTVDKKHLAQSVRCGTVSRQRHWVPVY